MVTLTIISPAFGHNDLEKGGALGPTDQRKYRKGRLWAIIPQQINYKAFVYQDLKIMSLSLSDSYQKVGVIRNIVIHYVYIYIYTYIYIQIFQLSKRSTLQEKELQRPWKTFVGLSHPRTPENPHIFLVVPLFRFYHVLNSTKSCLHTEDILLKAAWREKNSTNFVSARPEQGSIPWVVPLPSNSHHQDYSMFGRESQTKPSFTTVTGKGPHPKYTLIKLPQFFEIWHLSESELC